MNIIPQFDRTVANMMRSFGTSAQLRIAISEAYDPETSENIVEYHDYPVNAMFFDYLKKNEGLGTDGKTLIQSGDKQVFVQPPQKTETGIPLPVASPNKWFLVLGEKTYKVITLKQHNPSMTNSGCILYELYVRE